MYTPWVWVTHDLLNFLRAHGKLPWVKPRNFPPRWVQRNNDSEDADIAAQPRSVSVATRSASWLMETL